MPNVCVHSKQIWNNRNVKFHFHFTFARRFYGFCRLRILHISRPQIKNCTWTEATPKSWKIAHKPRLFLHDFTVFKSKSSYWRRACNLWLRNTQDGWPCHPLDLSATTDNIVWQMQRSTILSERSNGRGKGKGMKRNGKWSFGRNGKKVANHSQLGPESNLVPSTNAADAQLPLRCWDRRDHPAV